MDTATDSGLPSGDVTEAETSSSAPMPSIMPTNLPGAKNCSDDCIDSKQSVSVKAELHNFHSENCTCAPGSRQVVTTTNDPEAFCEDNVQLVFLIDVRMYDYDGISAEKQYEYVKNWISRIVAEVESKKKKQSQDFLVIIQYPGNPDKIVVTYASEVINDSDNMKKLQQEI